MKSLSKRFFTTGSMLPQRPIQTTDGKMLTVKPASPLVGRWRFRDTVIGTVTPEEDAEWSRRMSTMSGCDLGRRWVGDLTEKLDAVKSSDPAKVRDAVATIMSGLADYTVGNDLGTSEASGGPAGALAFNGGLSKAATADNSGGAQLRKWRDRTSNDVASINAANREYYGQRKLP
jgi:hypothetical protein